MTLEKLLKNFKTKKNDLGFILVLIKKFKYIYLRKISLVSKTTHKST